MTEVADWVRDFAVATGMDPPDEKTIDAVLRLAAVAAHGSARQAAPVACWLAGLGGISLDEAERIAQRVSDGTAEPVVQDLLASHGVAGSGTAR